MGKVAVEVKGGIGRTITVPVPDDLPAGEYAAVLVPVKAVALQGNALEQATSDHEQWDEAQAKAWEKWSKEVETLQPSPQPVQNEYHQALIEKYRKQGLDL